MTLSFSHLRRRRVRGRSQAPHPVAFVVGVPRSGTTLMRLMLDSHPELALPPETKFVPRFIRASGGLRFGPDTAARAIVADPGRRWDDFGLDPAELLGRFRRIEPFNTADALRTFYELYAEGRGKPRWGDKTPEYLIEMTAMQETLPEARFVHVIRDGRDASLSQNARRRRRGHEAVPSGDLARRWRDRILAAREAARGLEGYLEVRFEDLVEEPEAELRRVCELIELDYDPAMLAYHDDAEERLQEMAAPVRLAGGRHGHEAGERVSAHAMTTKPPSSERVSVWKQEMSEAQNREFLETAGRLLDELGYETARRAAPDG